MTQEFYFDWHWDLQSPPEAIWPLASDTNRFNRDTGQPEIEMLDNVKGTRHLRMKLPIIQVEWEEEPFEWTYPYSFGVLRTYSKGPIDEMRVQVDFDPRPDGGTQVRYQTWMKTDNILARLVLPFVIGVIAKTRFERVLRVYDRLSNKRGSVVEISRPRGLSSQGRARFRALSAPLVKQGTDPSLLARLEEFLDRSDELLLEDASAGVAPGGVRQGTAAGVEAALVLEHDHAGGGASSGGAAAGRATGAVCGARAAVAVVTCRAAYARGAAGRARGAAGARRRVGALRRRGG